MDAIGALLLYATILLFDYYLFIKRLLYFPFFLWFDKMQITITLSYHLSVLEISFQDCWHSFETLSTFSSYIAIFLAISWYSFFVLLFPERVRCRNFTPHTKPLTSTTISCYVSIFRNLIFVELLEVSWTQILNTEDNDIGGHYIMIFISLLNDLRHQIFLCFCGHNHFKHHHTLCFLMLVFLVSACLFSLLIVL